MEAQKRIKSALISVFDKTNLESIVEKLNEQNVTIYSTGGTQSFIENLGINVVPVEELTSYPSILGGRVKTLHPKVHGGILARRGIDEAVMTENDISAIDIVVVNLYPFANAVSDENCSLENAIENIDIGGPTMVRAAAKNHKDVTIVVNAGDYDRVLAEMNANDDSLTYKTRFDLAIAAYEHTAAYDGMIANYFGKMLSAHGSENAEVKFEEKNKFPRTFNSQFIKAEDLRYGENSHQDAAFYVEANAQEASVSTAKQIQGKALSYNNIADTDSALECVKEFDEPACVIVKHANPCGVSIGDNILAAYEGAYRTDPTSAFGGIIAFNRELDADTAEAIVSRQFVEVIIAPSVSEAAAQIVAAKPNLRLLECGEWSTKTTEFDLKRVNGGLLVQDRDQGSVTLDDLKVVTKRQPTSDEMRDLQFCWKVAKYVKSNAIVYVKNSMTIGVGAGQMSRVYSAKVAGIKAADENLEVKGSVMASDAFFPFRDGLDAAAEAGITAVIQPGGSMRDDEVIAAADEHNIAMVFTGMRHFRH